MGINTKNDSSKVVDRSKIRRERLKNRNDLKMKNVVKHFSSKYAIYFDGRKDKTDSN